VDVDSAVSEQTIQREWTDQRRRLCDDAPRCVKPAPPRRKLQKCARVSLRIKSNSAYWNVDRTRANSSAWFLGGIWLETGYVLLKDRARRVQAGDSNEVADDEISKLMTIGPEVEFSVN
jgi:hypothetical protein